MDPAVEQGGDGDADEPSGRLHRVDRAPGQVPGEPRDRHRHRGDGEDEHRAVGHAPAAGQLGGEDEAQRSGGGDGGGASGAGSAQLEPLADENGGGERADKPRGARVAPGRGVRGQQDEDRAERQRQDSDAVGCQIASGLDRGHDRASSGGGHSCFASTPRREARTAGSNRPLSASRNWRPCSGVIG